MDAALNGLVYYLETVATRGQLLKFLEYCGEEPEDYDDELFNDLTHPITVTADGLVLRS